MIFLEKDLASARRAMRHHFCRIPLRQTVPTQPRDIELHLRPMDELQIQGEKQQCLIQMNHHRESPRQYLYIIPQPQSTQSGTRQSSPILNSTIPADNSRFSFGTGSITLNLDPHDATIHERDRVHRDIGSDPEILDPEDSLLDALD
jgi:hypothetical protein